MALAANIDLVYLIGGAVLIWFVISNILFRSPMIRRLVLSLLFVSTALIILLMILERQEIKLNDTNLTLIVVGTQAVLVIVFAYLYQSRIVSPLNKVSKRIDRITEGDLVSRIDLDQRGVGEARQLIYKTNDLGNRFRALVSNIKGSADELAQAAEELASGSEEVAATTEEVTGTIQTIAEGAAEQVRQLDDVSRILNEMVEVTEDSIRQIGVTSRITLDLAEQTNLVSLNAAIEAAKASEHGEGFQVVAEHVRQLSVESKDAATTVREIINDISDRMRESVDRIVTAVDQIASVAENTAASSEEAAAAAEEQSASLQEITQQAQKLAELSDVTERNIEVFKIN